VYMTKTILLAQELFGRIGSFQPDVLVANLTSATSVRDGAETLGLIAVLDTQYQDPMRNFLDSIPPALDAAMLAAIRNALARKLPVAISWQPGYDFELRLWDVSTGSYGMVNIHLVSPHPVEPAPAS